MPCSNPKDTKERRFAKTKANWEKAGIGTGGLKKVRFFDFDDVPNAKKHELLTQHGPAILTSDGLETCVVMTYEQYFAMLPDVPKNRGPLMVRLQGVLFREVI